MHVLNTIGLIHQDHMQNTWARPENGYPVGETISARLLYTLPNGTTPYLTLHPLCPYVKHSGDEIKSVGAIVGSVQEVKVVRLEKRGIIFKVGKDEKGIVPIQRASDDLSFTEEDVLKHFPANTVHPCRIFQYSMIDRLYIGSFQKQVKNYLM